MTRSGSQDRNDSPKAVLATGLTPFLVDRRDVPWRFADGERLDRDSIVVYKITEREALYGQS
jgi:hypothetical protein